MEIQQSDRYATFTTQLGWQVHPIDGVNVFIKSFFFLGSIAKLQRPPHLPDLEKLISFLKSQRVRTLIVEASRDIEQRSFTSWKNKLQKHIRISSDDYLPTKTRIVDLTQSEDKLFASLTSAKRRGVRRAQKHNVRIRISTNIRELITIKSKSAGLFGQVTTYGLAKLWRVFNPDNAAIVLAYKPEQPTIWRSQAHTLVGGVLLVMCDGTSYYWIAGATKRGKKLFAPTLLAWEAIKLSKSRGQKRFDFVGVWDERRPKNHPEWKGFTKFKEGFGGTDVYYPI